MVSQYEGELHILCIQSSKVKDRIIGTKAPRPTDNLAATARVLDEPYHQQDRHQQELEPNQEAGQGKSPDQPDARPVEVVYLNMMEVNNELRSRLGVLDEKLSDARALASTRKQRSEHKEKDLKAQEKLIIEQERGGES